MASSNITILQLEANELNYISMMFIRCYCYLVIPLGAVGHLLSIYVFTRPSLRSNPCVMYFLAATIFGFLSACHNLPIRLIQAGYVDMDPSAHSILFCKIEFFFIATIRALAFWFIVLASGDRYLCSCTSATKRAWSSVRVAGRAIPLTVLICLIAYVHMLIFYKIEIVAATQKPICSYTGPAGPYRIFFSYFNLIFYGLAPPLCMLLFALLTVRNMNRSKRVLPIPSTISPNANNSKERTTDRQVLRMLLVQVLVYSVTALTYSIPNIIIAATTTQSDNISQVARTNLALSVVGIISTFGPCLSFYLFTLSSRLFRRGVFKNDDVTQTNSNSIRTVSHVR